ncbi:hypothetical protein CYY_000888 [Polysphondylium violaceum]|uniref:MI domain-containing protein n=1 Tax=Polysphondylium violaceum TaxID=133409 RepID=A0A8J4Q0S3_9MYCE|nr:hypothetical protein CYY_000888 [Polysphondylium violaceum]
MNTGKRQPYTNNNNNYRQPPQQQQPHIYHQYPQQPQYHTYGPPPPQFGYPPYVGSQQQFVPPIHQQSPNIVHPISPQHHQYQPQQHYTNIPPPGYQQPQFHQQPPPTSPTGHSNNSIPTTPTGPSSVASPQSPVSSNVPPQQQPTTPSQSSTTTPTGTPNRKGQTPVKPSVNQHATMVQAIKRTTSAPPSLEEQNAKLAGFTPSGDKRILQGAPQPQQQVPPPYIQGYSPNIGKMPPNMVPSPQGEMMYPNQMFSQYGRPMYYPGPASPSGAMPLQTPSPPPKKVLDIIDPNTNEKVNPVNPSSSSSSSSTTTSTTTTTPSSPSTPAPVSATTATSPATTTTTTTPAATTSTPGYVYSFSAGNLNLRKKKDSTSTTPATESTTSTPTPATPTAAAAVVAATEDKKEEKKEVAKAETTTEAETTNKSVEKEAEKPKEEEKKEVAPVATTSTKEESKPKEKNETVEQQKSVESVVDAISKVSIKDEKVVESNNSSTSNDNSSSSSSKDVEKDSTTATTTSTSTATTATKQEEEEEEEWEKKAEEGLNLTPSTENLNTSSSSLPPSIPFRNSGEKIVYSKEIMMSLKPKNVEEPTILKDMKNQIETTNMPLNRSNNKINKGGMNMNMNMNMPQYPQQMNMKYPPQMNMKYPPKGFNPNYNNKYPQQQGGNFNYQQQLHQHQQQQYSMYNNQGVQPPISSQPVNENRWIPTKVAALSSSQMTLRKAKFILNKISPEKFDVLTRELLELGIVEDEEIHRGTIDLIFEKAINEAKFCTMYSNLCKHIFEFEKSKKEEKKKQTIENLSEEELAAYQALDKKGAEAFDQEHQLKINFRSLLLSTCQKEYEKIKFESFDQVPENLTGQERTDFEEKQYIERKKVFGLIKFIGELFKQGMLVERVIHGILISLMGELQKPIELKLECFCKLLSIVGRPISQNTQAADYLNSYCARMTQLIDSPQLSQRIKFLMQNVLDLKENSWIPKVDESAKTMKEVENSINKGSSSNDNDRKNMTGVKKNSTNTNMFQMAFNTNSFTKNQPPKNNQPPPMMYNKNPAMNKPPAGFMNNGMMNNNNKYPQQGQYNNFNNMNNMNNKYNQNNNNQNNNSSVPLSSNTSSSNSNTSGWDKIKTMIDDNVNEYLSLQDPAEFYECIKLDVPSADLYTNVISHILTRATEKPQTEKLLVQLLLALIQEFSIFTEQHFKSGYEMFCGSLVDLFEDRPAAYKTVASTMYQFYTLNLLPLSSVAQSLASQVDNCGPTISKIIFEFILQFKDMKKAASVFTDNKIKFSSFFSNTAEKEITSSTTNYNKELDSFLGAIQL